MAAVEREADKSFDPKVVDVLKRRYIELERLARSARPDPWRLSTDLQIEKGAAPAAGFASAGDTDVALRSRSVRQPCNRSDRSPLENLLASANSIEPVLTVDETLTLFASRLAPVVPFDSLALYFRQHDTLTTAFFSGKHGAMMEPLRIPVGQGLTGWVAQTNRPILNGNPAVEPGWKEPGNLRSALAIPLQTHNGSVGVLTLYSCVENGFNSEDLEYLCRVSPALTLYVERNISAPNADTSGFHTFLTETTPAAHQALRHVT